MKSSKSILLKSVLAAGTVALASQCAEAWTAQELYDYCQGNGVELLGGYGNLNSLCIGTNPVKLSVNGTKLRVSNFAGGFDVDFTVSGNKFYISESDMQSGRWYKSEGASTYPGVTYLRFERVIRGYTALNKYTRKYTVYMDSSPSSNFWAYKSCPEMNSTLTVNNVAAIYGGISGYKINNQRLSWEGTISTDANGDVMIQFGPYKNYANSNSLKLSYYPSAGSVPEFDILDGYILTLYKPNATASDNKHDEPYAVRYMDIQGDTKYNFGITNFGNIGSLYYNGNVNNSQTSSNAPYYEWDICKGTISGDKVVIPMQNAFAKLSGRMDQNHGPRTLKNTNFYTMGFDPETQQPREDNSITGTVYTEEKPHHNNHPNTWHYNLPGGARHTYVGAKVIHLDPFGFTDIYGNEQTSWGNRFEGMTIQMGDDSDVTFDCAPVSVLSATHNPDTDYEITVANPGTEQQTEERKGFFRMNILLSGFTNTQYIKELRLYAASGQHTLCTDIPLSDATLVCSTPWSEGSEYLELNDVRFFPATSWNSTTQKLDIEADYTFFVEAVYKDTSVETQGMRLSATPMLSATHHAPSTYHFDLSVTGADAFAADYGLKVSATRSGILATSPGTMPVEVSDMSGRIVARGMTNSEIPLDAHGILLVRAGGKTVRIMKP